MSLTQEEREMLDTLITALTVGIRQQDFPAPPGEHWHEHTRGYLNGFLAGYLYHARGGGRISTTEQREIRRLVIDRTSELRRAVERASA